MAAKLSNSQNEGVDVVAAATQKAANYRMTAVTSGTPDKKSQIRQDRFEKKFPGLFEPGIDDDGPPKRDPIMVRIRRALFEPEPQPIGLGLFGYPIYPKGTKVGDLVMGEYGLYDPQQKYWGEVIEKNFEKTGYRPDWALGRRDLRVSRAMWVMIAFSGFMSFSMLHTLLTGRKEMWFQQYMPFKGNKGH